MIYLWRHYFLVGVDALWCVCVDVFCKCVDVLPYFIIQVFVYKLFVGCKYSDM